MNEQEQMAKALAEAVEKKVAQEMRNLQQELVAQKEASLPV